MQTFLRNFFRVLVLSAATLCLTAVTGMSLAAQQTAASPTISGVATDPQGKPVPSASVIVRSQATGRERSATTDGAGRFSISGLAAGKYTLVVNAPGFATINKTDVVASASASDLKLSFKLDRYTDEVIVSTDGVTSLAARLAPLTTSLDTRETKTVITNNFISNFTSPISDFTETFQLVPGAFSVSSAGVGLGQSNTSFRGMPDGNYTIAWDGIPFTDTNSVSHHSWAFFPSQWIGGVDFKRSPGDASDIGEANFGGIINLRSKDVPRNQDYRFTTIVGSYNTVVYDGQFDTGEFGQKNHPISITGDVHHLSSDGFQTGYYQSRSGGDIKVEYVLSPRTVLTGFSGVIALDANTPDGKTASRGQIAQSGYNYLANHNPFSSLYEYYSGYNVPTDFEYVALNTETSSGWRFSDKAYTYSYDNREIYDAPTLYTTTTAAAAVAAGYTGSTALGTENYGASVFMLTPAQAAPAASGTDCTLTPNTYTVSGTGGGLKCKNPIATTSAAYYTPLTAATFVSGDVLALPTTDKLNSYRTEGNILAASKEYKWGALHLGDWYEFAATDRFQTSAARVVPTPGSKVGTYVEDATSFGGLPNFHEDFWTQTFEPYVEALARPIKNLTVVGGLKFAYYNMLLKQNADSSKVLNLPVGIPYVEHDVNYHDWLPSINANYRILHGLSVYGQFGTGDVIPPSSVFDVPQGNSKIAPKPTYARTYQGGAVYKNDRFSADADYYYIHYANTYTSTTTLSTDSADPDDTTWTTTPASVSQGFELEGTARIYRNLSLYGNLTAATSYYQGLTAGWNYIGFNTNANTIGSAVDVQFGGANHQWVAGTPDQTEALALTYQGNSLDIGLTAKRVGSTRVDYKTATKTATVNGTAYSLLATVSHNALVTDPYFVPNFYANYTIRSRNFFNQSKIRFSVNNLANLHAVTNIGPASTTVNAAGSGILTDPGDALTLMPGRSVMASFTIGIAPKAKK
jgi:iron complex outermembrane receptor protein